MKRIAFLCLLFLLLATNGIAANFYCRVLPGVDITTVAAAINAKVIDSFPEAGLYLLSATKVPTVTPVGAEYVEVTLPIWTPKQTFAIVSKTTTSSTVLWYQRQPAMQLVNLPKALTISQGRSIVVADINSAVDYSHPALIGHLTSGYDFVAGSSSGTSSLNQSSSSFLDQSSSSFLDQSSSSFLDQSSSSFLDQSSASFLDQSSASFLDSSNPAHGHGTLVAGIIAAMAPQAMIMPLRVFDDTGQAGSQNIVKAIRYAVKNGAKVINMSLGMSQTSKAVNTAIGYAVNSGVIVVASAGNSNSNIPQYPSAYSGVFSVAATTLTDQKASFSNSGSTIDVDAPGANIVSAYPGGYYAVASGTSFSAPMVAAEAAVVLSYKFTIGNSITSGVMNIDSLNPDYKGQLGSGRIDLYKALLSK